jgi:hypothetical protein
VRRTLHGDLRLIADREAITRFGGNGERKAARAQRARPLRRDARRTPDRVAGDLARFAHTDEQQAARFTGAVGEQHLIPFSLEIPARQRPAQGAPGRLVERSQGWREVAAGGDRDRQQGGLEVRERRGDQGAVHARCAMIASANADVETVVAPGIWRARS